jgi:7-cyano-7-deazaguanine synthase
MRKTALLFSGGLDSFCAHRILNQQGRLHDLVYIPCGTETSNAEMNLLEGDKYLLDIEDIRYILPTIDLSELETSTGFVPLRNLLFLAMPVMHEYDDVLLAAVKGEGSLDKSHRFFKDTSELFSYILSRKITVSSPVDQYTKTQLVHKVLSDKAATVNELRITQSCYRPQDTMTGRCGTCNACMRRWVAMRNNNIFEAYDTDPALLAKALWETPRLGALREQPLGRWPDVILTNNELRKALIKHKQSS